MTDKELIQALRYCEDNPVEFQCADCPYKLSCNDICMTTAADRLEALLAENVRLKAMISPMPCASSAC